MLAMITDVINKLNNTYSSRSNKLNKKMLQKTYPGFEKGPQTGNDPSPNRWARKDGPHFLHIARRLLLQ